MADIKQYPIHKKGWIYIEIEIPLMGSNHLQKSLGVLNLIQTYIYWIKKDIFRFQGLKNETVKKYSVEIMDVSTGNITKCKELVFDYFS